MKIFSLYLPQYHVIPENNEWWGEGFTEWVNVKKAKPLYPKHLQPKHPMDGNYYDLMDKKIVEWQTSLMKKYGLSGMIYYHYYFCGKKVLEKPAENLLKWKDIHQPFFFCWANHSWNRAWKGSKEVLLQQNYGNISDWKKHFDYLLPFFLDERYEKVDNKPVFMLYNCDFVEKKELLAYFNSWCQENGFAGIYIIEECMAIEGDKLATFRNNKSAVTEKIYLTEPQIGKRLYESRKPLLSKYTTKVMNKLNQKSIIKWIRKYDGNELYEELCQTEPLSEDIIHGVFFEWDNTPRHNNRGFIITPVDKKRFFQYMDRIKNSDYVIVNAWNEWAEGMMLEPSEEMGYRYLEWITEWKDINIE